MGGAVVDRAACAAVCRDEQRALLRALPVARGLSRLRYAADLVLVSPSTGHVDTTDCAIVLRPGEHALDVRALGRYLASFAGRALEHEEAAVAIAYDVAAVCSCRVVVVISDVVDECLERSVRALGYPAEAP